MNLRTTLIPHRMEAPMLTPHVHEIRHMGASPYAPPLTPSQQHAAKRCQPLTAPVLPPVLPVDVYPLEEDAA